MKTRNIRRGLFVVLAVLFLAELSLASLLHTSKEALNVSVVVTVPSETPESDKIFLTGNLNVLGKWIASGVPLERQPDASWQGQFVATVGQLLECKVTRGTWKSVEKSKIDKTYRTLSDRENTGIAGSSLGGLISLYVAAKHPEAFSRCGALSPSIWWADCWIVGFMTGQLGCSEANALLGGHGYQGRQQLG
mgnify:CR=1 FL=1